MATGPRNEGQHLSRTCSVQEVPRGLATQRWTFRTITEGMGRAARPTALRALGRGEGGEVWLGNETDAPLLCLRGVRHSNTLLHCLVRAGRHL